MSPPDSFEIEIPNAVKCQAFITYNLFISLHIRLCSIFSVYVELSRDDKCDFTRSSRSQLRSPSVLFICDVVIVRIFIENGKRKKLWKKTKTNGAKEKKQNLTPNSCQ